MLKGGYQYKKPSGCAAKHQVVMATAMGSSCLWFLLLLPCALRAEETPQDLRIRVDLNLLRNCQEFVPSNYASSLAIAIQNLNVATEPTRNITVTCAGRQSQGQPAAVQMVNGQAYKLGIPNPGTLYLLGYRRLLQVNTSNHLGGQLQWLRQAGSDYLYFSAIQLEPYTYRLTAKFTSDFYA